LSAIFDEQLGPRRSFMVQGHGRTIDQKNVGGRGPPQKSTASQCASSDQRIRERLSTRTTSRSSFGSGSAYRPKPKAHVCFGVIRVGGPRIAEVRSNPINY